MTTNNRMFGNLLITKFVKVMSILLVACMLVITLTACGTVSQKDVEETTEYSTEGGHDDRDVDDPDEPIDNGQWHDEDPTGEPSEEPSTTEEPSTQPQGAYTYNVYGYTISMDINVDDYITGDWFLLAEMAYDLGWVGNDIYTAVDTSDPTTYSSQWFAHHDGDIMTRIDLGYYNEEQVPGTSGYQFRTVNVRFLTNSNSNYYTGGDSDILHRNLTCDFGKHYSDCEYKINGTGWYASYEDIVMITYMFWSAAENTGNNPLVPVFGTDSGTFGASVDSSTISYSFP